MRRRRNRRGKPGHCEASVVSPEDEEPGLRASGCDIGFALSLFLMCGLFVYVVGGRLWSDVREVVVYRHTEGKVTKYVAPDVAADRDLENGQITYTYRVDGSEFEGVHPPEQRFGITNLEYTMLRETRRVGEPVDVYFDPSDPTTSTLEPRVEPVSIFMLGFLGPFVVFAIMHLRGADKRTQLAPLPDGTLVIGGNALFFGYLILSVVGCFGGAFATKHMPWQYGCLLGVLMPSVLVPAGVFAVHWWTKYGAAQERTAFVTMALTSLLWWSFAGVFAGLVGYQAWWTIVASARFVPTNASVVKSTLKTHRGESLSYEPIVIYRYDVDNATYENNRIRFTTWDKGSKEWAESVLQSYPVGAVRNVYYDPSAPANSVLERGFSTWDWLAILVLSPFVAIGVILVVRSVKAWRCARVEVAATAPTAGIA